jgi:hypothetical protein
MEQVPPEPSGAADDAVPPGPRGGPEQRLHAASDPGAGAPDARKETALPNGAPDASGAAAGIAPAVFASSEDRPRRSRGATVAIWTLGVALVLVAAACVWGAVQYVLAQDLISDQQEQIRQQQDEIDEQKKLIEKKETFGAAMNGLMDTASQFDGVLTASIVPWNTYEELAARAWTHRWDAFKLDIDITEADAARSELATVWSTAQAEAASNATGTAYETTIDQLGRGLVRSVVDEKNCGTGDDGILGCVYEREPYLVHFDAAGDAQPFMTDELRVGVAYHEFAHVLQFTNTEATAATLPAFGGDHEFMADCFALTFLDGWKLDHRVWVSSYEYWDVSVGYGRTCDAAQQQAIRDWYGQLGVRPETVSN